MRFLWSESCILKRSKPLISQRNADSRLTLQMKNPPVWRTPFCCVPPPSSMKSESKSSFNFISGPYFKPSRCSRSEPKLPYISRFYDLKPHSFFPPKSQHSRAKSAALCGRASSCSTEVSCICPELERSSKNKGRCFSVDTQNPGRLETHSPPPSPNWRKILQNIFTIR